MYVVRGDGYIFSIGVTEDGPSIDDVLFWDICLISNHIYRILHVIPLHIGAFSDVIHNEGLVFYWIVGKFDWMSAR